MKSANLLLILYCYLTVPGLSQSTLSPQASHYLSSGAYSKNFSDAFSSVANTAALASIKNFTAGVYGERRFMLAEIGLYSSVIALPTKSGNFALTTQYFGYKAYNETEISIGYGRKVAEKIDVGARFNYHSVRIPAYGNASALNFDIGAIIHITEQLSSGISVHNPFNSKLGKNSDERLNAVYRAGLGYEFSANFFTAVEVIKEQGTNTSIHAGFQYKPIKQLFARAGIVTGNTSYYFGAGYLYKDLRLDVTVSIHQQLGLSPGLLLLYQFKKNKDE
ncbi:MAG: hypothetical protein QM802_08430 [Agriterribacter sp.]